MEKYKKKKYKNWKLEITAQTMSHEFEFPDGSYSVLDIQEYIEYIILTTICPIHVYSNRINNRLAFKIKNSIN